MTAIEIGVISDSHGLLRPEAVSALQGSDLIIHAGDVGLEEVLEALSKIAPVRAIRGNVDLRGPTRDLPDSLVLTTHGITILVLHDLDDLDLYPPPTDVRVVISGHSHQPKIEEKNGVLFVNPGSAGPRRFYLPVTVARLRVEEGFPSARLIEILGPAQRR